MCFALLELSKSIQMYEHGTRKTEHWMELQIWEKYALEEAKLPSS